MAMRAFNIDKVRRNTKPDKEKEGMERGKKEKMEASLFNLS